MRIFVPIIIAAACGPFALAQVTPDGTFKMALPEHKGQLKWSAKGFKIIENSAKSNKAEIGLRGQDGSGRLTFLAFLFLAPESVPLTSGKCRDTALSEDKKSTPSIRIMKTSEIRRPDNLPVSMVTYTTGKGYTTVRGFVATGDICGDLEFYSKEPISADDADLTGMFSTYELNVDYIPEFADVVMYAEVLYRTHEYKAAAPIFEKALAMVPKDGAPFPSATIAKRIVTDQAGMSYGIAGELAKARAIFEKGITEDPDYPLYYYNLACTDAGEKKLAEARLHLEQAFARKAKMISGETIPDPTKDDSFLPYQNDKAFWAFLKRLQAGK